MGARRNIKAPPVSPRRDSHDLPKSIKANLNNRSRSLDGLLDEQNNQENKNNQNQTEITKSCDKLKIENQSNENKEINNSRSKSLDELISDNNKYESDQLSDKNLCNDASSLNGDKINSSSCSTISSDSRKKKQRNFMDRCVNKVRSLIKK